MCPSGEHRQGHYKYSSFEPKFETFHRPRRSQDFICPRACQGKHALPNSCGVGPLPSSKSASGVSPFSVPRERCTGCWWTFLATQTWTIYKHCCKHLPSLTAPHTNFQTCWLKQDSKPLRPSSKSILDCFSCKTHWTYQMLYQRWRRQYPRLSPCRGQDGQQGWCFFSFSLDYGIMI